MIFRVPPLGSFTPSLSRPPSRKASSNARDRAGILSQLAGFTLEPVNFLDDFNGNQDGIVLEVLQGVWIMEQHISVEDVILHENGKVFDNQMDRAWLQF